MSLLRRVSRFFASSDRDEEESSSRDVISDFWYRPLDSVSGSISANRAMRASVVHACVKIIGETVGSLPLITYRRLDRGKERATDHPMYKLLRWKPNRWQTSMQFVEMMTAHAALRGTAFASKSYTRGVLTELMPMHPDRVRADLLENGSIGIIYTEENGASYRYTEDEVFFLTGFAMDRRFGVSVIGNAAQAINMALGAEDYGARYFANDASPRGVITHPGHFRDKETRDQFRRAWERAQSGNNRHRTAVLEDGLKYEQIDVSNEDAQFLETRRFQVADIARIFRVPLVLLQETDKATSWGSGIEQFMLGFVVHSLRPWLIRWEQSLQVDFFDDDSADDEYFAEFLVDALLRGDITTRYAAYNSAIDRQWMTPNEARERENMNPVEWGDEPYTPPNATKSPDPAPKRRQAPAPAPNEDTTNED